MTGLSATARGGRTRVQTESWMRRQALNGDFPNKRSLANCSRMTPLTRVSSQRVSGASEDLAVLLVESAAALRGLGGDERREAAAVPLQFGELLDQPVGALAVDVVRVLGKGHRVH